MDYSIAEDIIPQLNKACLRYLIREYSTSTHVRRTEPQSDAIFYIYITFNPNTPLATKQQLQEYFYIKYKAAAIFVEGYHKLRIEFDRTL